MTSTANQAVFLARADQAYAEAHAKLVMLLDSLVEDMRDREEITSTDAPYWASSLFRIIDRVKDNGGISDDLMAVYMAAVYRLARQQVEP